MRPPRYACYWKKMKKEDDGNNSFEKENQNNGMQYMFHSICILLFTRKIVMTFDIDTIIIISSVYEFPDSSMISRIRILQGNTVLYTHVM